MPVISMRPNRLATLALSGAALILLCLWAWGAGYRCNPTPSLPVGLYRLAAATRRACGDLSVRAVCRSGGGTWLPQTWFLSFRAAAFAQTLGRAAR